MALSALSSLNSLDLLNSVNYTRCWILDASKSHVGDTKTEPNEVTDTNFHNEESTSYGLILSY